MNVVSGILDLLTALSSWCRMSCGVYQDGLQDQRIRGRLYNICVLAFS